LSLLTVLRSTKTTKVNFSHCCEPHQSNMTQIWTPREVLGLVDIDRCNGTCLPHNDQCHTRIERPKPLQVNLVIAEMAQRFPGASFMTQKLPQLARNGLCMLHQDQCDRVVREWRRLLDDSWHDLRHLGEPRASQLVDGYVNPLGLFPITRPTHLRAPAVPRASAGLHALAMLHADAVLHAPTPQPATTLPLAPTPPFRSAQMSREVHPSTAPPRVRLCYQSHVRRLAVDEECSICYSDALMSTVPEAELVWCKAGCGKSMDRSASCAGCKHA
jgi:hypothetical protein